MKKILSTMQTTLVVAFAFMGICLAIAQPAYAQANEQALCEGSGGTYSNGSCSTSDNRTVTGTIQQVADILVFIVGSVSVIMIIIGGIRYAVSNGEQSAVSGAKNTILYAIVGVVVAFMAYAIVHFVTNSLGA